MHQEHRWGRKILCPVVKIAETIRIHQRLRTPCHRRASRSYSYMCTSRRCRGIVHLVRTNFGLCYTHQCFRTNFLNRSIRLCMCTCTNQSCQCILHSAHTENHLQRSTRSHLCMQSPAHRNPSRRSIQMSRPCRRTAHYRRNCDLLAHTRPH